MENIKSTAIPFATLFSLSLVLFLDALVLGIVFPLMGGLFLDPVQAIIPLKTSSFDRHLWYSVTMASFFIFAIVGAPLLGDLSDKIGRRKVLLLSLFINGISCLICAAAISLKQPLLLIAARALAGLSAGNQPLAQAAMIDLSTPETKTRNISLISLACSVGFIAGPLIGGLLSNPQQGFNAALPFEIAAVIAFLNTLALFVAFQETFHPLTESTLQLWRGVTLLWEGFRHRELKFWIKLFLIDQLAWATYFQALPLICIQVHHYTTQQIGWLIMTLSLSFALALGIIVPWALKKISVLQLLKIGFIIITLTMLIAGLGVYHVWSAWFSVVVVGISQTMIFASCLTKISDAVTAEQQGWAMGIGTAVGSLAWGIAALIVGLMTSLTMYLPFFSAGVLFLGGSVAICKLINNRHHAL